MKRPTTGAVHRALGHHADGPSTADGPGSRRRRPRRIGFAACVPCCTASCSDTRCPAFMPTAAGWSGPRRRDRSRRRASGHGRPRLPRDRARDVAEVVVGLGRAGHHLDAARPCPAAAGPRYVDLLVDGQVSRRCRRRARTRWSSSAPASARLDAQPAEDAAQVVDLVDAAVPLAGAERSLLGVGRALDEDGVGRAGPRAQLAPDALLEAVRVAVELVPTVVAGWPGPAPGYCSVTVFWNSWLERHREAAEEPALVTRASTLPSDDGSASTSTVLLTAVPATVAWRDGSR